MTNYFRVQAPHPEDLGKTVVRMKETKMQELGIKKGDIVKITAGRSAYAFCLPWKDDYDKQNERRFVFLDESSKTMPELKVSDQTYANLRNYHIGNLVDLEQSNAVKADKITVKPLYDINDAEKPDYNLGWLQYSVVVSIGDRIIGRHNDPKKTPGFFVIGGKPDSQAWIVDKSTQVEISDKMPENLSSLIREPGSLNNVIPIVQKIREKDFEATMASIEIYDNCIKVLIYVKDTIVCQEYMASGMCTPTIRAWDDLGNEYLLNRYSGQGGGMQFGGAVWAKTDRLNFTHLSCILIPTVDVRAHKLTLSVEQMLWEVRRHPRPLTVTPVTKGQPVVMTPMSRSDEKCAIHGGPWQFKMSLK